MANVISEQPVLESLLAAYKPIIYRYTVDAPCPIAFCDIYIDGVYYRSESKTHTVALNTFEFDVSGALQEYLKKFIGPNGGSAVVDASVIAAKLFCRFRATTLNGSGFTISAYTAPLQSTDSTPAVDGTGEESDTIYVINATLKQEDNENYQTVLEQYKQGWPISLGIYPLTRRPNRYRIGKNDSDYFPIFFLNNPEVTCLIINYKLKGTNTFIEADTCGGASETPNLVWAWDKVIGESVDLTGLISGTFSKIDWGDGTIDTLLTHTYVENDNYTVQIYDSNTTILVLFNKFGTSLYKLTTITTWPSTLQFIRISNNYITSIPSLAPLASLTSFIALQNDLTTINFSTNVLLTNIDIRENAVTSPFDFAPNTLLQNLYLANNQIESINNIPSGLAVIQAEANELDLTSVNHIINALDGYGNSNGICLLDSQTPPQPPTGLAAAAVANLISKGWNVNTD